MNRIGKRALLSAGAASLAAAFPVLPVRAADPIAVHKFVLMVEGQPAAGYVALPAEAQAQAQVRHLVVVAHGRGHGGGDWQHHLAAIAARGVVAVAMDYSKTFAGVARGAAETVAAARYFQAKYPTITTTTLLSVSMGGTVASIALAEAPGLFRWWVAVEGVSNLAETWAAAKFGAASRLDSAAVVEIEQETGGTPAERPEEYRRRSATLRVDEIVRGGLEGAIVVHAPADGLVPYNQSRELASHLYKVGLPVDMWTVVRRDCRLNHEGNTTIAGYSGQNSECLAGHARERLADHVVMRTSFGALADLIAGTRLPSGYAEFTVDEP